MRNPRNDRLALTHVRHPGLEPGSIAQRTPPAEARARTWMPAQGRHDESLRRRQSEVDCKIGPMRIALFDQFDLPSTMPVLEALLGRDRCFHGVGNLVPDQMLDAVTRGVAVERSVTMLHQTTDKIRRDADVERAVAPARQDVDAGLPLAHSNELGVSTSSAQHLTPALSRGLNVRAHLGPRRSRKHGCRLEAGMTEGGEPRSGPHD